MNGEIIGKINDKLKNIKGNMTLKEYDLDEIISLFRLNEDEKQELYDYLDSQGIIISYDFEFKDLNKDSDSDVKLYLKSLASKKCDLLSPEEEMLLFKS